MALFWQTLGWKHFLPSWAFFEGLRTFWWFQWIWALFRVPTHFTHGSVKLLEISIELAHTQANWGQSWNRALYLNQNLFPNLCFLPGKDAHCDPAQKNLVLHFFVFFDFLDNLVPRNRDAISCNQGAISRNRGAIQKVYGHYWYLPPKCGDSIA